MVPAPTPAAAPDRSVRAYYRAVAPFIDGELDDRGDLPFWRRRAGEVAARAGGGAHLGVLELGCGTGRVTAALADAGLPVTGVDASPEMLDRARRRLAGRLDVALVLGDARELPVRGPFALVVAADDPFVHLLDDAGRDRALAEAARVLAPGGRLLLETFHLAPERQRDAATAGGWRSERPLADGWGTTVRETWRLRGDGPLCDVRYAYLRDGRALEEAAFTCRAWTPGEAERRLGRAGLRVARSWDAGREDAPGTVLEARRPPEGDG